MNDQRDRKWSGAVFALVCDDNLNYAANALALEMTTKVDADIHVFIETKPRVDYVIQRIEHPQILYHHNVLFKNIDAEVHDNPRFSRAAWGRIMLPKILGAYKRIIYCDIDVLLGELDPHILNIDLPNGIGMVRDENDILPTKRKLPENQARFRLGEKYFNSGFIIIDPSNWDSNAVQNELTYFFNSGNAAVAPFVDQDFLNTHFINRIVELSPLYNLQYRSINLGALKPSRVAIRHFIVGEKPYYQTNDIYSPKTIKTSRENYAKMLANTGIDLDKIPNRSTSKRRAIKAIIRKTLYNYGVKTFRTIELHRRWVQDHETFVSYLKEGTKGVFQDNFSLDDILKTQNPKFDGFEYYTADQAHTQ